MVKFAKVDPKVLKVRPRMRVVLRPKRGLITNVNLKNFWYHYKQELLSSLTTNPFVLPGKWIIGGLVY